MFLINQEGRLVDLPARMEESGFQQAREVLSISKELMNGIPSGITMSYIDTERLRDNILRKYPNVVTDDVYMEQVGWIDKVSEKVEPEKQELVNIEMTKKEIVDIASANGVKLSIQEQKLNKAKLIELIDERHAR